jgi:putative aminopeptidase FrvX
MTPDRPSPPALLWTAEDVATATALSVDAIERERKAGRLVAVKVGRAYRYRPTDVRAWIVRLAKTDSRPRRMSAVEQYGTPQAGTRAG